MGIEIQTNTTEDNSRNYEVEGEVYLEEELTSALEELRKGSFNNHQGIRTNHYWLEDSTPRIQNNWIGHK